MRYAYRKFGITQRFDIEDIKVRKSNYGSAPNRAPDSCCIPGVPLCSYSTCATGNRVKEYCSYSDDFEMVFMKKNMKNSK